jgi:phosphatidate cytidylyltransferase
MANENLHLRLFTALSLVPLVAGGVLYLPTVYLAPITGVVILLGGWEWTRLMGVTSVPGKWLFLGLLTVVLGGMFFAAGRLPPSFGLPFFAAISAWWLLVGYRLLRLKSIEPVTHPLFLQQGAIGMLVLAPAWAALIVLHQSSANGPILMLFLLFLIWTADSGAYFAGYRWGRTKLAPVVSPGKTRAGLYGALAGAVCCGLFLAWLLSDLGRLHWYVLLAVVTVLFSVVGDLYESLCKRRAGLKDSGDILPGHGGVLDRVDSLTAAAPVFLVGLMLLGAV